MFPDVCQYCDSLNVRVGIAVLSKKMPKTAQIARRQYFCRDCGEAWVEEAIVEEDEDTDDDSSFQDSELSSGPYQGTLFDHSYYRS